MSGKTGHIARKGRVRNVSRLLCSASLMAVALALPTVAQAQDQDRYWDANGAQSGSGGDGDWNTTSPLWSESNSDVLGPYRAWINNLANPDNAIFGVSAPGVPTTVGAITLTSPMIVHDLTFQSGHNWALNGGTLTLAGTTPTVTTVGNATINSVIAGTAGLTKAGGATLTLTGTNTFSGGITINAGTLWANDDGALGALSNAITTAAAAVTGLRVETGTTSRTVTIGDGGRLILNGAGVGGALIQGNGAVDVAVGVAMSNDASTYTGETRFSGCNGVCSTSFTSIGNLGEASSLGAPTTVANGTITWNQSSQYSDNLIYFGDGDTSNRNWVFNAGSTGVFRNQGFGVLTLTGDIAVTGGANFVAEMADIELLGVLSGNANMHFTAGAGSGITLGGANTYTGTTGISGGMVNALVLANAGTASTFGIGSSIALGDRGYLSYIGGGASSDRAFTGSGATGILNNGTGALTLGGPLSFVAGGLADTLTFGGDGSYAGSNVFSGVISGNGDIASTGGSVWELTGDSTRRGALTLSGGTLRAGSASAFGTITNVSISGGTLDLGGYDLIAPQLSGTGGTVALTGANLTVSGLTPANNSTYAGSLVGDGGLIKRGSSMLTLAGQSSYTGATTLQGGTLALDFTADSAPVSNIIGAGSPLVMAGGTLSIMGAAGETNSQAFNGLTVTAGTNRLAVTSGIGGVMNVSLGALDSEGGLLDFALPVSGSITTTHADGALGWATVNGRDYAQVTGGVISAFTAYTDKDEAASWLDNEVISDDDGDGASFSGTVAGSKTLGGLQYTVAQDSSVAIDAGETLSINGAIIVASSTGTTSKGFTGGMLTGPAGGGALGFLHNGAGTFLVASQVTDNGVDAVGITKAGTGVLTFNNNNNSYTGATVLSGGVLQVSSIGNGGVNSAMGASSAAASNLVIESGRLVYTGGTTTTDRGFTLVNGGASREIEVVGGTNLTFTGLVTSADDAGLTKFGAGTLTLANDANDYIGVTRVEGGTLSVDTLADGGQVSGIGAASSDSANLVLRNGGGLQYTGGTVDIDRGLTIESGVGRVDVSTAATTLTMGGVIVGPGKLDKYGDGTLVLTGANTHVGNAVYGGTLRAGASGVFGNTAGGMWVYAGGILDLADNSNQIGALIGAGDVTLGSLDTTTLTIGNANSGEPGFTGTISGAGNVTHTNGTQVMTGCGNSYTGVTTLTGAFGGSVLSTDCIRDGGENSGIGASGGDAGNLVIRNNGVLNYTAVGANQTTDRGFTLAAGYGYIQVAEAGTTLEFTGDAVGAGALVKRGGGTLILSGDNTYTGQTRIEAGRLVAGSAGAFDQGTDLLAMSDVTGAVFDLNGFDAAFTSLWGGGTTGGDIELGAGVLTITGVQNATFSGAISGVGNLIKGGGATQALASCDSSYTGTTTIAGGVLQISCLTNGLTNSSIGASSSDAANLVIQNGALQYVGAGDTTDRLFTLGATTSIHSSGSGALVFTNTGAVAFSTPDVAQSITLRGTNTGDNSLAAQIADNGAGRTTFTKADAGTWILTNSANTYTGATRILGGVLGVDTLAMGGTASSIGQSSNAASNLVIGSGGTLRYTGDGDTTDRLFTLGVGTTNIESSGSGAIVFSNTGEMDFTGTGARVVALGGDNTDDNVMGVLLRDQGANVTSLAKNGSGTWILTGDNTFTGSTVINDGNLVIGNGGTTGNAGAGNVIVDKATSTLSFNRSDVFNFTGAISGPGAIAQIGAGTTVLTATNTIGSARVDTGVLQVNGALQTATFAMNGGGALVVNGTVEGAAAGSAASFTGDAGASTITVNAGTLRANGDLGGGNDALTVAGTLDTGGAAFGLGAGDDTLTLSGSAWALDSAVVDAGTGADALVVNGGGSLDAGSIAGFESLTKNTTTNLSLTGDHGYASGITINAGNVQVGIGGTSGSIAGDVVATNAASALQFERSDTVTYSGVYSGVGQLVANSGALILTGDNTYSGATHVQSGTLQVGDGGTSGDISDQTLLSGGNLAFNRSDVYAYGGVINGGAANAVRQIGSGTTIFSGTNVYAGATEVLAGTLLVNGDQTAATGLTSVASGATLGGIGTIGGDVVLADGATLAAGSNATGVLAINGDLVLGAASNLSFEFGEANVVGGGGPLNDLVNVAGDLTLDGTVNVTEPVGGSFGPGVYRMFNYAGTLTDNGATVGSLPGGDAFVQTAIANQVNLVNTAGLTLNFWDGAAGPKNDSLIQGGDGVWRAGGGENNWTEENGLANADYAQDSFAIFQGTGGTVTVDNTGGDVLTLGMQFTADGYTVTGGPLTLTGAQATVRVGDGSASDAGITTTIDAVLSGSAQLVKTDGGTLVLAGVNDYAGGTAINGGTIRISDDANLGDAAGALSINGGTLNTTATFGTSRAVALTGAGVFLTEDLTTLTLTGPVSGAGSLVKDGAGALILDGTNSYAGGTTISAGLLQIGAGATTGSIVGDVLNNGALAFNRSDALTLAGVISGGGAVNQIGGGVTVLTADNTYTGGTTIDAGVLQLGDGGVAGGVTGDVLNNAALVFNRSNEVTFAGLISGSGTLEQAGGGVTILTGANSYAGVTTVSAGTLLINGDQSAATGDTLVNFGGALGGAGLIGGDVLIADGATLTPGDATGPGALTIAGSLGLSGGSGLAYEFGQSNVVGGPLNDLVRVGGDLTLDGTIDVTVSAGGSFDVGVYRVMSYGGTLTDNGLDLGSMPADAIVAVQTSVAGQINLVNSAGATLNFWDGAAGPKIDGFVNGGDGIWQNSSGNNNWADVTGGFNGPFNDGQFAIFSAAAGTVTVDNSLGAVTASGMQFVSDGYRLTGQDISLVGPQSVIRVGDGTVDGLRYTATIDAALTGGTQLVKTDLGTLILAGTNSYTGGTRINVGTLRISSDVNLGDAAGNLVLAGGTLHTTADITSARDVELIGTGTFITDVGTNLVFSGALSGTGDLIKDGAGVLALNDTSNHTGTTTVRAGSLFVNGDLSAAIGLTTVASGSTLGGSGIIGGDVVVADGGTLAPGNSPGTLTINGDVLLSSGSVLDFEFGEANVAGGSLNDLVNIGGDLTLDGTINVSVPTAGSFGPGIYRVFNYGGALTDNGLALGALPGGSAVTVQTAVAGQVNLVNTAGLTLSFWDGDAGPKNNGAINGGSGVWRIAGASNNWTDANGAVNADYTQDSFAIFAGASGTVTVDNLAGDVLASGLQFAGDGYTITGDSLTLTGGQATVQVGDGSAASASYSATIASEITGAAGLVKTDAGTLVLTGANSYAGGTTIAGGVVRISADANLGDAAGGLTFDGGTLNTTADVSSDRAIVLAGAGYLLTDTGTTLTLGGPISGPGALAKGGAGTLVLTGAATHLGGATISTGTLQLGDGGASGSLGGDIINNASLITNRADAFSIDGAISGSGSLTQVGGGEVTLTADNSYTGGTTIAAGSIVLGNGGVTGGILGDVVNNGNLGFERSDTVTFAGVISGSGSITQQGNGATVLTGANSYAGETRVSAGTLLVNGDQSAATGVTNVLDNATLGGGGVIGGDVNVADGATLAPGAGTAGALTINGSLSLASGSHLAVEFGAANAVGSPLNDVVNVGGDLTLDGTIDVTVTPGGAFDIGLYRVANYGGILTNNGLGLGTLPAGADVFVQTSIANQVNLINVGGATLNFWDGASGPKFNGAVNGGDGVWQNGLGNDNWADGTGAVNAGYADGAFAIFSGAAGTVTIDNSLGAVTASGLQFATDGYTLTGEALTLTGSQAVVRVGDGTAAGAGYTAAIDAEITGAAQLVKTDAGTLILTGANSYTGGTLIAGGAVRISADANLGDAAGSLAFDGGTLNTSADIVSTRVVTLTGTGTLLTDAGATLSLGGAISGVGALIKSGDGVLVLSGSGSYSGATSVTAGTLLVNGDYAGAAGATSVADGASIGGIGVIGGDLSIASGATLAPGANGAGTLTVNGDLSLSAGSRLAFEFGQANTAGGGLNDLVNVGGDLVLDGTIDVSVSTGGAFDVGVYRVFNYGGTLTNNGLSLGAMPGGGGSATVQTSIAGQVNLVNSAGLTLSFWDGAAGPKNNSAVNGGAGTWQGGGGNDNWTEASGTVNAAYSDGAFAVFGATAGTVTVDDSLGAVTAAGMQFAADGYTITGDAVALTGPQSTIRVGDGSTAGAGFVATIDSLLSGDTQLVKTDAGTLVLGGANTYTGGTLVNGGMVEISEDANLGAASGDVTLDGGTLATTADVTSARDFVMAGAGAISTANGTTFTFHGTLSGTGALSKTGAGTLLLTGDNSGFGGSTYVEGGLMVNGSLCGDVNVAESGRLSGTGTVCSTFNAGTVAPGESIGTLTVAGTYTGAGGILEIEAELAGDASPTDRLVVTDGTAGSTQIEVINTGGLGAQTVQGIKIVDVTGGTSAGVFTLNGDYVFEGDQAVIAGAYGYRLYQGGVSTPTDGDWYLRSSLLDAPNEPQAPLYQPGVPLYESYGPTLQRLNGLSTLQERVGNRQWAGFTQAGVGMWGRIEGGRHRPEAVYSTSGSDLDIDDWSLQAGLDKALLDSADGTLIAGVNARYGEADAQVRSRFGNGMIETRGYGVGATLTWYGSAGFYADAQAQMSWYASDLQSGILGALVEDHQGTGEALSLEIGKRASLGGGFSITPQAQLAYSNVRFDLFADPSDALVSSDEGESLRTRWGVSLDHQKAWNGRGGERRTHFYGLVNLTYEWLDGSIADVSGTSILRRDDRLWGELGVGGSYSWNDGRVTVFSEVAAETAIDNFGESTGVRANAGLRMKF